MFEVISRCQPATEQGEDRVLALADGDNAWLAVADGVGGAPGGANAAAQFVELATKHRGEHDLCTVIRGADRRIADSPTSGLTTAVLVSVTGGFLWGASVGDSTAVLLQEGSLLELTEGQSKNPKVGSGNAIPFAFGPELLRGTLLLATDGLFNYVTVPKLVSALRAAELSTAADQLVELARLPSGSFQDDLGLVLCRQARQ